MRVRAMVFVALVLALFAAPLFATNGKPSPVRLSDVGEALPLLQAPPVATPTSFFAWDYLDAELTSAAVDRFEMRIDGGAATSVGLPEGQVLSGTIPNGKTYQTPVPPLQPGNHTVEMRACNPDLCGPWTSPFAFKLAVVPAKIPDGSVRIVSGGA